MNGIVIIDKPKQMTSHDVVNIVRRSVGTKKVGHTGTLDPDATGVLVVAINDATKIIPFLEEVSKTYLCEISVGYATTTEDATGEITSMLPVDSLSSEVIDQVLDSLKGTQKQIPPMYSAVKVNGKKLYEYARNNIEVERTPKDIVIDEIKRTSDVMIQHQTATFFFRATVSKGTFIRTLCVQIGKLLGYPAHMKSLVREQSGLFSLQDAYSIDQIRMGDFKMISIQDSLSHIPQVRVDQLVEAKVLNGMKIALKELSQQTLDLVVVLNQAGKLLAIYQKEDEMYKAVRVWK